MAQWYKFIMRSEINPLRNLPPAQRFQVMIFLSIMWTTIFTASMTLWVWYGELMTAHILLALGTLITGSTFRLASQVTSKVRNQLNWWPNYFVAQFVLNFQACGLHNACDGWHAIHKAGIVARTAVCVFLCKALTSNIIRWSYLLVWSNGTSF